MNRRPFVVVVCCWLTGASLPSLWQELDLAIAAVGVFLVLAGCLMSGRLTGGLALAGAAAILLALAERYAVERAHRPALSAWLEQYGIPDAAEVSGYVSSKPEIDGDRVTFRLDVQRVKAEPSVGGSEIRETVMVRVRLKESKEKIAAALWKRGDLLEVAGTPELPAAAGNFGAFDYRGYLERKGVYWQWSVRGADEVHRMDARIPLQMLPLRSFDELRSGIGALMERLYSARDAGYMKGLVAGIQEEVDPALYDAFSRLGLTHVLAISGLHVGVVVFALLRFGALARLTRERSIDLAMAAMPLYMLVTGASPSAVRACLMALIALALSRRHRLKDGLHLLSAAALAMVVWDPLVVEDVSFQLSFAVTAGLLTFTPAVSALLVRIRFRLLRDALAVGITAQAVSLPLTVYYFHGFHLLSLPANLVLVPFISFVVMPLGMASVALGAFWAPLGIFPAKLASYGNDLSFAIIEFLNGANELRTVWPQPSRAWVAAAYFLLGATGWYLKRRADRHEEEDWTDETESEETVPLTPMAPKIRRTGPAWLGGIALAAVWGGWLFWGYRPAFLDRDARVQFLDVGQGDGILIRTGEGKNVLIDAGGTVVFRKTGEEWRQPRDPYEIGRKLLVPLLRQRGVRRLDALVLTHLDADHIGGAEAILRDVPVGALICNGTWKQGAAVERLFHAALAKDIPVYAARSGAEWKIDGSVSITILYPAGPPLPGKLPPPAKPAALPVLAKQNKSSIVLLATVYGRTFLLTGDVESPGEAEIILNAEGGGPQPVDVMKTAHHGSRTSTSPAWLASWVPAEAVISVGRRNTYGHPHPAVVERILSSGIALFRTDRDGEIQYRITNGGKLWRRIKLGAAERVSP